jgi:hypothetical protein
MARAISWYTKQSPFSGHEIGTTFSEPEREKKSIMMGQAIAVWR